MQRAFHPNLACAALAGGLVALGLTGCGGSARLGSVPARYTCADLEHDFQKRGDAPGDRGQAVVDALVARVKNRDRASANVRDELVYQLARSCATHGPGYRPTGPALRAVRHQLTPE